MKKVIQWGLDFIYPIFKNFLPYQIYAYLAVGAINTALNIALFAIFFQFVLPKSGIVINGFPLASYTVSLLIAFMITVPTGFWLAKYFAFNEESSNRKKSGQQLFKYFLVVLQGLGTDYLLMKGLIVFLEIYPTVAKVISTVIVLTLNYLLQKYFTFAAKKAGLKENI
jgi:putative flippase GtrA